MDDEIRKRLDHRIGQLQHHYQDHGRLFKVMWVVVAVVIVLVGLVMVVFPGPSTVVIPLGLAMLAGVFGWARRLLVLTVERGMWITNRLDDVPRAVRILGVVAGLCLAAAVVALPLLLL